ncbi:hypothetical protein CYMTET_42299 [Cymbomonas tetramitiformis]|uniref:Uncharacterized protein n=1 Tax=Cymbomonas tetramitiformis TaxID=36881 RepID=A0AAE0C5Q1_9CHLO|nr:hypothetical protein CYMTET_42299 [Cymbomonas tetramitiformis]
MFLALPSDTCLGKESNEFCGVNSCTCLQTCTPVIGAAPYDPAATSGTAVRDVENTEFREILSSEVARSVREPGAQQGNFGFDYLVSLQTPLPDVASYVSGAIDGVSPTDPFSPSHLGWERYVNYSGNSTASHCKKQMMRVMFVNTLGESSEFEHTPLCQSVTDLIQDGSTLKVKDNVHFPSYERFTTWCRKLGESYTLVSDSGVSPYCPGHPHREYLHRSATLVITRFEFLIEMVDYMRAEWPTLRFEAAYLLLITHYISARWANKQPFSDTFLEDREFLRLGASRAWGTSRREIIRQYVVDYFPHTALQRLLSRVNATFQPEVSLNFHALPPGSVDGRAQPAPPVLDTPPRHLRHGLGDLTLAHSVVAMIRIVWTFTNTPPDHRLHMLKLILRELQYWYPTGCPIPASAEGLDPYRDIAQVFKAQLMELGPTFHGGQPPSLQQPNTSKTASLGSGFG